MLKAALAGAMLATTGVSCCLAQDYTHANYEQPRPARQGPSVTGGHIAQLRAALKLTAEQQRHWPAVASALRGLSRKSANSDNAQGYAQRASAAVISADAIRRVASAARPLIASLTEQQKAAGMAVIRASGLASLASAM